MTLSAIYSAGQPFPPHQSGTTFESVIWNSPDVNITAFLDELATFDTQNGTSIF